MLMMKARLSMEVLNATNPNAEHKWRIVIPSEAGAAISQLTDTEQDAVRKGLGLLQQAGGAVLDDRDLEKLNTPDPLYLLRLRSAPDLRVVVRVVEAGTIEVEDVVRTTTLRNVFHTHAS